MRTDDAEAAPPLGPPRPESLSEALGGVEDGDDMRELWAELADDPGALSEPEVPVGDSRADSLLLDPIPPVLPTDEPTVDPSVPAPTVRPPLDPVPELGEPESTPTEPAPTWRERRRRRRAAKDEARREKARRRSDRLELRRHRILPRTVIGISMLLLAAAVGAAFSGAGLYAYYDWRLSENEDRVGTLTETLETRLTEANEDIENVQNQAVNDIRQAAEPLEQLLTDTRTVSDLTPTLAPSVFFISTLDEDGAPSVGSGFVVSSDDRESLILTSFRTVEASTQTPAPGIEVRGDGGTLTGRLHSWDPERDLALVIVEKGGLQPLAWAPENVRAEALGRRIYVASGLGGAGVSLSPGLVVDQSQAGLQHSAPVGNAWQGGPVLTAQGEVLGIASVAYAPLGFDPGGLTFAVPVEGACERVLTCSGGDVTG